MHRNIHQTNLAKERIVKTKARNRDTVSIDTLVAQLSKDSSLTNVCVLRRTAGIGDILMLTPALRQLKKSFPHIKLTFAFDQHSTKNNVYYDLIKNAPFIDCLADARFIDPRKYDAYVDVSAVCIKFEMPGLPAVNRIDLFARAIGFFKLDNHLPFFKLEPSERIQLPTDTFNIVLHTASFDHKRTWTVNNLIQLIKSAEKLNVHFFVLDFNHKIEKWEQFNNVTNISHTNLREMAAYIQASDLFIGPDSGPMHLAGALHKESLVLFGAIPSEARINYYANHKAITANVPCLGCWYKDCKYDLRCMKQITAQQVLRHIKDYL